MRTQSVTLFSKQATCPSAETLMTYHMTGPVSQEAQWIAEHLQSCEFCSAEFKLLAEHASFSDEECPRVEIPAHLRSLAEALLCHTELSGIVSVSEIYDARVPLTLTDA